MADQSPMDGVDLHIRSPAVSRDGATYPLPFDDRLSQGDQYRKAKEDLQAQLLRIKTRLATSEGTSHQPPNCTRCVVNKQDIMEAYRNYYLSSDLRAWYQNFPQWHEHMSGLFDDTKDIRDSLPRMQQDLYSALRIHLRKDLCAPHPSDHQALAEIKSRTAALFDQGRGTDECLEYYLREIHQADSTGLTFFLPLQDTRTAEQRAQLYINYYCPPSWSDRPEQKNFKLKYSRMFEQLIPHDAVVSAMRNEAQTSHASKLSKKKGELNDLRMAQTAHLKNKAKKAELNQQNKNRGASPSSTPMIADCGYDGCRVELDLSEENLECAICEWFVAKDPASHKRRTYYCSAEHAEEDFDRHESRQHKCCMLDRCVNYPRAGPPGATEAGGICQQCAKENAEEGHEGRTPFYYFCSEDCYTQNLDYHRSDMHMDADHPVALETLDLFKPAQDMRLVTRPGSRAGNAQTTTHM